MHDLLDIASKTDMRMVDAFNTSGACAVVDRYCIQSPNFPEQYGNSQTCTMSVAEDGVLSVLAFDTEPGLDTFTVGRRRTTSVTFSGTTSPSGINVSANDQIQWVSDTSGTRSGWKVCNDQGLFSEPGASACYDASSCRAGYYCPMLSLASVPCPAGTSSNVTGATSDAACQPCMAGDRIHLDYRQCDFCVVCRIVCWSSLDELHPVSCGTSCTKYTIYQL